MCGIAFAFNSLWDPTYARTRMDRALAALRHRGPDHGGVWQDESVIVGHRRLSIIDVGARNHQPMLDPSSRYILTYNGEVYNFIELRNSLKERWQFRTSGDTEVVLAGLILLGPRFLSRMEGMWGLALWDNRAKTLLLARDRIGKKPLYFDATRDKLSCASELPALTNLQTRQWDEDSDSTADYLRYGYYLPGKTAYSQVQELLPGHYATWRPGEEPCSERYWELSLESLGVARTAACEQLHSTLQSAVKNRLVADVPLGTFLSGGIDSSLITAIVAKDLGLAAETFTIGFSDETFDERLYARQVASHFQTNHHEQVLDSWTPESLDRLILDHVGQPFSDSSILPTALVSELASRHVKVALAGDGGDELFSGYQRYQAKTILRWYSRLPKFLRKTAERSIRMLPEPASHHSRSLLKKAHLFVDVLDRQSSENPYIAPVLYSERMFSTLAPDLASKGHKAPNLPEVARSDDLLQMMYADALVYLPQDILTKVDRASMAHSLETREPFLDHKVIELAFSFPRSWHRSAWTGKKLLRSCFLGYLPDEIWRRRKQGFGVPIHSWFRGKLGDELLRLLVSVRHPFRTSFVNQLVVQHRSRQRDHGHRLWNIYVYLLWKQTQ